MEAKVHRLFQERATDETYKKAGKHSIVQRSAISLTTHLQMMILIVVKIATIII